MPLRGKRHCPNCHHNLQHPMKWHMIKLLDENYQFLREQSKLGGWSTNVYLNMFLKRASKNKKYLKVFPVALALLLLLSMPQAWAQFEDEGMFRISTETTRYQIVSRDRFPSPPLNNAQRGRRRKAIRKLIGSRQRSANDPSRADGRFHPNLTSTRIR